MPVNTDCLLPRQTRIVLLLLAVLAISCGTVRNPALEHARDVYHGDGCVDPEDRPARRPLGSREREIPCAAGKVQHVRVGAELRRHPPHQLGLPAPIHVVREHPREAIVPRRDEVEHRRHEALLERGVDQVRLEVQVPETRRGERMLVLVLVRNVLLRLSRIGYGGRRQPLGCVV